LDGEQERGGSLTCASTESVTVATELPETVLQVMVYLYELFVRAPVDSLPEEGLVPVQSTEATQLVTFCDVHERVCELSNSTGGMESAPSIFRSMYADGLGTTVIVFSEQLSFSASCEA
jgi:hypothetical protein